MIDKLVNISDRILENQYLNAIKRAFISITPVILAGAVAMIIANLPIPGYNEFMAGLFGDDWNRVFDNMVSVTFNLSSLYIGTQMIANIAQISETFRKRFIDVRIVTVICLAGCLFLIFPKDADSILDVLNAVGLFRIMIGSLVSVILFELAVRYSPDKLWVIGGEYEDSDTRKVVSVLAPASAVFLALLFIKIFIGMPIFSHMSSMFMDVYITNFAMSFRNTLGLAILFVVSVHGMWFFGIHGSNILEPITQLIYTPNAAENAALISAGLDPTYIFTKQFFDIFVLVGGSGCTLALILAIVIFGKNTVMGKFVKTSGFISLFNINELILYGLPIIFNPIYLIPFIGVPIILTIITYIAFASGLVPLTNNPDVMWTCPIILGGFYATGSVRGAILQLVNVAVATLCYAPFVKISRKVKLKKTKALINELINEFEAGKHNKNFKIDKNSHGGMIAEILANDIKKGIERNEFYLVYQPLVLKDDIVGAEALLRWKHPLYGEVSPIIILYLAKEFGYLQDITKWIVRTIFNQSKKWSNMKVFGDLNVADDFKLSINMSFDQLCCFDWVSYASDLIFEYRINPKNIEIEISEEVAFEHSEYNLNMLNGLLALGFDLSIDNFGMGYSSLVYLCAFKISEVKIDGEIIKAVLENPKSLGIVRSIVEMCNDMDIRCVAKMPEHEDQINLINELGGIIYQSYLHSKPLLPADFENFVNREFNRNDIYDEVIAENSSENKENDGGENI
ncbi:MAG: PTS sugar transporter subunit IIC/EAL domain-containing protein [Oscillospiraceae bacterium]|nr:PTS sugar transporter subunit IIC/EAL domain-containing protein [Oscillospiraceae bacterium]